jgi:hypothetical protein
MPRRQSLGLVQVAELSVTAINEALRTLTQRIDDLYGVTGPGQGLASGANVYRTGPTSLASATATLLTWNGVRYDTDEYFSTAAPERLTVKVAGIYLIGFVGHISFEASAIAALRLFQILLNHKGTYSLGTVLADTRAARAAVVTPDGLAVWRLYQMAAGDHVGIGVYQDSGETLAVTTNDRFSPEFMIQRMGG